MSKYMCMMEDRECKFTEDYFFTAARNWALPWPCDICEVCNAKEETTQTSDNKKCVGHPGDAKASPP